jgi:hypothetical protein
VQLPFVHVGFCPEQPAQLPPLLPHAPLSVPETQLVPLQHPPLHARLPTHDVVHTLEALQALPLGHWLELLQPQTPFDRHLLPSGDEVQSLSWTQAPPASGGGGGASDVTSGCASMCAVPVSLDDESMPDVESIPTPLSPATTTS